MVASRFGVPLSSIELIPLVRLQVTERAGVGVGVPEADPALVGERISKLHPVRVITTITAI